MREERLIPCLAGGVDFPAPELALKTPNGLLAYGGSLDPKVLLSAYQKGIFPWYDKPPILWWSPDPRAVLFLQDLHISRSLFKTLKRKQYQIAFDQNFTAVMQGCAKERLDHDKQETGTWINPDMLLAYQRLHEMGYAHSIEVYSLAGTLIGGLYGVSMGRNFFAESMFSHAKNASKIALVFLAKQLLCWEFEWIDCQFESSHLTSMGCSTLPRKAFLQKILENNHFNTKVGKWEFDPQLYAST